MDQPDVERTMTYVSTAMEIARDHVYRSKEAIDNPQRPWSNRGRWAS